MPYIFIDESGQFTKHKDDQYFVIGSFTIGNIRRTEKQFRSWCRSKFPRKIKHQSEIKFSEIKIDEKLRLKTLKFISNLDVRINYVYLARKNIPDNYFSKNVLQSGYLYTNIVGELLEMFLPTSDLEFRVFCDQRHLKGIKTLEFKEILKNRLIPQLPNNCVIQIEMIDSKKSANIQIVDWISGAIAHFIEKKKCGEKYYTILKNNIINPGKELFKN
jgi:hypothetical protein